uniref:Uncharacterized protein n=1 Tax=Mustela putorius furo TaxID=9669 RepID=M3YAN3_MUSPF
MLPGGHGATHLQATAHPAAARTQRGSDTRTSLGSLWANFLLPGVPRAHVDHAGEGPCGVWGTPAPSPPLDVLENGRLGEWRAGRSPWGGPHAEDSDRGDRRVLVLISARASRPPGEVLKRCPDPIPEHLPQDPQHRAWGETVCPPGARASASSWTGPRKPGDSPHLGEQVPMSPSALAAFLAGTGWCPENARTDHLCCRWRPDPPVRELLTSCAKSSI